MKSLQLLPVLIVLMMLAGKPSKSQIQINSNVTPQEMVNFILSDGIIYDNVTFTGAAVSRGIFGNGQTTNLGLDEGIFLTSGAGYIIPGPNNSSGAGVNNQMPGDPTLNTLTTSTTYDASVLQFDLIPGCDTIRITYVFGTEEDNWVGTSFNDVFGFFVSGPKPTGGQYSNFNLACNPQTVEYIENTGQTLQYDQFTAVITAKLPVIGAEEYHIKLAIADCGDGIYDSGVFIEKNSISSNTHIDITTVLSPPGLTENMVEGHVEADLIFHLQSVSYSPVTVYYSIEGDAMNGYDYEEIDNEIYFAEGQDTAILHIAPIQDGLIEGDETIRLIIFNTLGGIMVYDTVELIIEDYVEMISTSSPNTMICPETEIELWVQVFNGFPPYQYFWEPGGFTDDTIVVSPATTTMYKVTYSDLFNETGKDSVKVTVLPVCELETFYFEALLNPGLPYDVYGEVMDVTVLVIFPPGTNLNELIPSCTFMNEVCPDMVGVVNDFTNPLVYEFVGPGGCSTQWLVIAEIETGISDNLTDDIIVIPNPSDGRFFISSKKPCEIKIMDLTGKVVFESSNEMTGITEIDLTNQSKGMYFIRVKAREMVVNRKLIVL
jgi:hypothetical protein